MTVIHSFERSITVAILFCLSLASTAGAEEKALMDRPNYSAIGTTHAGFIWKIHNKTGRVTVCSTSKAKSSCSPWSDPIGDNIHFIPPANSYQKAILMNQDDGSIFACFSSSTAIKVICQKIQSE